MTQDQLDRIWEDISNGKYGNATYRPERIPADGKDIMSVPNHDETARRIYERKNNGPWQEVPYTSGKSQFE